MAGNPDAASSAGQPSPAREVCFERLDDMVGSNPAVHERILDKFLVATRKQLEDIGAALRQGDNATAGALAHKLKSSARAIGADAFADACVELEAASGAGDGKGCAAHAAAMTERFAAAVIEIETYLAALR